MKIPSLIPANFPWLSTKFSFLLVIPLLLGLVSVPTLSTVAAPVTLHSPAAELALTSVVSTKTHGGSGDFSIDLPLTGPPGIECRSGGPSRIVFTFTTPVTFTSASVTAGTGSVSSTSGSGTTIVTVNLTGVTNAQWITLTLFGVNNGTTTADVYIPMGALLGDTNGDLVVDSVDRAQTLSRSGQPTDGTNFRSDVNADGIITSGDVFIVQSNAGMFLPTMLLNCTWSAAPVAPALLLDSPVVTVGGNMYLFGGVQGGAISAASFKFDGTTWTPIAPLPAAVEFPAAVTDGTDCYILGGALTGTGTPQTTLWKYNVALNSYTTLAPFTVGTWNHSAVYLSGKIYKWCGTGPATASAQALEIYDVAANTWSAGANYPLLISFTSGWTQGGFIYCAGGIQSVGSLASAKTYRYDPALNTWDDAAIADLPVTRWGAATAFYSPDVALAGGYVAGTATANISSTVISWNQPTNTWNSIPNMLQARSRMTGAVLGNSVYVVGGRCTTVGVCDAFQGTTDNQKLTCLNVPTVILSNCSPAIVSAGPNGVLDPGEMVTVALGVQNTGGPGHVCTTNALVGTLLPGGGVTSPSAPQNYGGGPMGTGLCSGTLGVSKQFSFTVDPQLPCGGTVTATLQMQDGATNYGNLTYSFVTGTSAVALSQNFDGVVAPALPAGWTSTATGIGVAYVTSTTTPNSPPNAAFAPDPSNVGDSMLVSPTFAVPAGGATLTFKNHYITESTFDGVVLEFSIDGGATFNDITTGGNAFITGGYTGPISTAFGNPIAGRNAWNGTNPGSPAYITSTINMPPAALGMMVQLKWRMASDASVASTGSWIDDVVIRSPVCGGGSAPVPTSMASVQVQGGVPRPIFLPATECRQGSGANLNNYQLVVTFPSPVTVEGVSVTSMDCSAAATVSVNGNVATVDLTGVANAQVPQVVLKNVTMGGVDSPGSSTGNVYSNLPILLGDSNNDCTINVGDTSLTKSRSGQVTDGINFRSDVNKSGDINVADTQLTKGRSGDSIPCP